MKTCLIVTGGTIQLEFAGHFLKDHTFDLIIAVDGGLEALKPLGLIPHAIVGDFDTVCQETFLEYHNLPNITWNVHHPEKDETDTELAVQTALSMGADSIAILGGTGGRMDHLLGNLHLLDTCLAKGVFAYLIDAQNKVYLLKEGKIFKKQELFGTYISFIPLTEIVKGITLTGFKYPLEQKDIAIGKDAGLCISNELVMDWGQITFTSGILICMESQD